MTTLREALERGWVPNQEKVRLDSGSEKRRKRRALAVRLVNEHPGLTTTEAKQILDRTKPEGFELITKPLEWGMSAALLDAYEHGAINRRPVDGKLRYFPLGEV